MFSSHLALNKIQNQQATGMLSLKAKSYTGILLNTYTCMIYWTLCFVTWSLVAHVWWNRKKCIDLLVSFDARHFRLTVSLLFAQKQAQILSMPKLLHLSYLNNCFLIKCFFYLFTGVNFQNILFLSSSLVSSWIDSARDLWAIIFDCCLSATKRLKWNI